MAHDLLVVGGGIYGVTTALELRGRGYSVALLDPGPLPHPLAASTDINKVIRMEYGAEEQYMEMVEAALPIWRAWNERWGEELYHETGVTMFSRVPLVPGSYEYESYAMLLRHGHTPERLNADEIARRFPAWKAGTYVDGFYHALGGYAESGRVVERLIEDAKAAGVNFHVGQTMASLIEDGGKVVGVRTREGGAFHAEHVMVAAGTWTHVLIPELAPVMRSVGMPVFHLKPSDPSLFTPPNFLVFMADISHTGWYGFPMHPKAGVVKIANHGVGEVLHPEKDERVVRSDDEQRLREMLADTFPALLDAPIVYTRRCLYCDTLDEHFWIAKHPQREGLSVAAGGSGHGFKFGPVLGSLIADMVEGRDNPWLAKFRWRNLEASSTTGQEASRYHAVKP